jgi:hypothetical protein
MQTIMSAREKTPYVVETTQIVSKGNATSLPAEDSSYTIKIGLSICTIAVAGFIFWRFSRE